MKNEWYKHFIYVLDEACDEHKNCSGWQYNDGSKMWAGDDYKFCPYCGTRKPKRRVR